MPPSLLPVSSGRSAGALGGGAGSARLGFGGLGMTGGGGEGLGIERVRVPLVLRRLGKFRSMDFELAFSQLTYLVIAPRRVYRQTYHQKQTKNVWARDDPAIIVLIGGCLIASGIAWSVVYRKSAMGAVWLIAKFVLRDFLAASLLTALLLYLLTNRLLLAPTSHASALLDNRVEFAYAFDVAVNAFFPAFLVLGVGLLPLAGVVVGRNWISLVFGNTLFLIAAVQCVYVTYLGYSALPFIVRSELLLAPLLPVLGGYLISLLGFNIPRHALELYFGEPWK